MIMSVILWLLLSIGFALFAPYLTGHARPDAGVRLLVASSLDAAVTWIIESAPR